MLSFSEAHPSCDGMANSESLHPWKWRSGFASGSTRWICAFDVGHVVPSDGSLVSWPK